MGDRVLFFAGHSRRTASIGIYIKDRIIAKSILPLRLPTDISLNRASYHLFAAIREYRCHSTDKPCRTFLLRHTVQSLPLRDQVSVVLQKNVLFSGTILENLRWGDENASLEECKRACRLACADEFIEKMPDGYDTYLEQGGTNVSGGQRQRLCIARALLKKPKVLILDDSTSAVDTATDARIRQAFAREIPDTTKFIIAQRVSSVSGADRILVLDDGVISGFDTHENLLKTNPIYQDVYESQTSGNGDFDEGSDH